MLHGKSLLINKNQALDSPHLWPPLFNRDYEHFYGHYQAPIDAEHPLPNPLFNLTKHTGYLSYPLFSMYHKLHTDAYQTIFLYLLKQLKIENNITTNAPRSADILLNEDSNKHYVLLHYLNFLPQKKATNLEIITESQRVINTHFSLKLPEEYASIKEVKTFFGQEKLPFTKTTLKKGIKIDFTLPILKTYEVIVLNK